MWKWITHQLEECKKEHAASRERIEELHGEIKNISCTVGELKGQLSVCVKYLPIAGREEAHQHDSHHHIDTSHD